MQIPDDPISKEIASLQKPIAGRRLLSWFFFVVLILMALVLPVVANLWPAELEKISPDAMQGFFDKTKNVSQTLPTSHSVGVEHGHSKFRSTLPTFLNIDMAWNPDNLSDMHRPWEYDCKVCHSKPFERVKDKDCMVCHQDIGDHVSKSVVTIESLNETRCATCHREHKGEFGLKEQNERYVGKNCVACHENLKQVFPETKTENVQDFANKHPEFRVQVNDSVDTKKLMRVREHSGIPLIDKTSLKFPHDVHLKTGGILSPEGKVKMECADCHKPDSNKMNFVPVTMKENCQHCHALRFEMAVPNREVPHGPVDQVLSTLREFYSYVDVNGIPLDKPSKTDPINILRPGEPDPVGTFIRTPGGVLNHANASAQELFEKTSCVICHEVTRSNEPGKEGTPLQGMVQWKITPIPPLHAWMPKAKFDHSKHISAQCTDCHTAPKSTKASDVLMPSIRECHDCHVGKVPVANKVTSDCGLCHGFHMTPYHEDNAVSKTHPSIKTPGAAKQ